MALTGKSFISAMKVLDEVLTLTKDLNDRTRETELLWRSAELSYDEKLRDGASTSHGTARLSHSPSGYLAATTLGQPMQP